MDINAIPVLTSQYRGAHGHPPRGWGLWAFYLSNAAAPTFAPGSMMYSEAKRWAQAQAIAAGRDYIQVAS